MATCHEQFFLGVSPACEQALIDQVPAGKGFKKPYICEHQKKKPDQSILHATLVIEQILEHLFSIANDTLSQFHLKCRKKLLLRQDAQAQVEGLPPSRF